MNLIDAMALLNKRTPPPEDAEWRGRDLGDGLVAANLVDISRDPPMGYVGAWTLVCPDGNVIVVSSNPGIHHFEVVEEVVKKWYADGRAFDEEAMIAEIELRTERRASS